MQKQQLSTSIKRARDIMRKDAGLSSDLDRTPQLSWILFLKSFDELEKRNEALNPKYRSTIESPYRWRDWAANDEGKTGDELLKFVNDKLLPYLRGLKGTKENDPRDVLASLFAETYNRMLSGYLLREVVNLIDQVNFQSKDDIFTLSHLYESILKEMRDAAGTSGEFYTPRPVVRFIVEMIKPKIGEKVLDPACGTGGFLVEAYGYLKRQAKTAEDWDALQYKSLYGIEKKPMPYLLGMMNLILHGIEIPNLRRTNTLTKALNEITEKDKYDVIITNPPFGGEEEKGIQDNFPLNSRTADTALLFMQFIMRSLKTNGRCGIVVPNGFLYGEGVATKIKKQLIDDFNLFAIVRLPKGVFAPYTGIETNLLFFKKGSPTKDILFCEHPLPKGRNTYNKTNPLEFEELENCFSMIKSRANSKYSWLVAKKVIEENNYNLDIKNPSALILATHQSPELVIKNIAVMQSDIVETIKKIETELKSIASFDGNHKNIAKSKIAELILDIKTGTTPPSKQSEYFNGNINWFTPADIGKTMYLDLSVRTISDLAIKDKKAKMYPKNSLLFTGIGDIGRVGIISKESSSNQQITSLLFNPKIVSVEFMYYWFKAKQAFIKSLCPSTTLPIFNQSRIKDLEVIFPKDITKQNEIVEKIWALEVRVFDMIEEIKNGQEIISDDLDLIIPSILNKLFDLKTNK
jgi:type I restriction enzyme M protein